jgi:hypothetical protein
MAQILPVWLVASNPGKGSGATEGLVSRAGAHFLECDRCVGNEGRWASCSNENLGLENSLEFHTIACR